MSQYYVNGLVIQKKNNEKYKGIDGWTGGTWYFNSMYKKNNELVRDYDKYVEISEGSFEFMDVCINKQYLKKYVLFSNRIRKSL